MWFGTGALSGHGAPLLFVSCIAMAAAVCMGLVRGSVRSWWLWGFAAGVTLLLAQLQAGDLILFAFGELVACWSLALIGPGRQELFSKSALLRIAALFALQAAAIVALQATLLYPGQFFAIGLLAGVAATMVEWGMRRQRWWFAWAVFSGAAAILVTFLAMYFIATGDLFAFYLKFGERAANSYSPRRSSFFLEVGTGLYWLWRVACRLATTRRNAILDASPSDAAPAVDRATPWEALGSGYRRVLRLVLVWPALLALSFLIFTPWVEVIYRLPPTATIPAPQEDENHFADIVAFPKTLDWSMTESREISRIPTAAGEPFYQANRGRLAPLDEILIGQSHSTVNYDLYSAWIPVEEEDAVRALMAALFMIHTRSIVHGDLPGQFESAHLMLLLARPLRRDVVPGAYVLGRTIEEIGMMMTYQSRLNFDSEQCQSLILQMSWAARWEESTKALKSRDVNWVLAIRGWRERVERACYPQVSFTTAVFDEFEDEHQALRATLICELALRRYALDHDLRPAASLDELVPTYLSAIPTDPYSGQPVLYHKSDEGPQFNFVYSVGWNKRDDNGISIGSGQSEADDVSIRNRAPDYLLETWFRPDFSKPTPAADEELEEGSTTVEPAAEASGSCP